MKCYILLTCNTTHRLLRRNQLGEHHAEAINNPVDGASIKPVWRWSDLEQAGYESCVTQTRRGETLQVLTLGNLEWRGR